MHLVLVSAQHSPTHGGIGAYVWELVHAARDVGWRIDLVTRAGPPPHYPPADFIHAIATEDMESSFARRIPALRRIERIRPYRYGLWSLAVARKLLELEASPDVIEFVDCQAEGLVALTSARVRQRFRQSKFVVSAHTPMWLYETLAGADSTRFGRSIYYEWERLALAAADGVIAPSRMLMNRLANGLQSLVAPFPMRPIAACAPATSEMILLIGAVQPQKGVVVWARSLNRVLLARPRATAVLIGPDTPTAPDGLSMAAHVQRLINPRFMDRFRWLGALSHEQVMRFVDDSSLVVVPSTFESFSFAAAEAVMRGRPVIISDHVGLGEHLPSLVSVPCDDTDALAEAQLAVLDDLSMAYEHAMEQRQRLIESCSPHRHVREREQFLSTLVPANDGPASTDAPDAIEVMATMLKDIDNAADSHPSSRTTHHVLSSA